LAESSVDLVETLTQNWARAITVASGFVMEAEKQAALVYTTQPGEIKRIEARKFEGYMGSATGALSVLDTLIPGDLHVRALWGRVANCPMIMVTGPVRQLRLIQ